MAGVANQGTFYTFGPWSGGSNVNREDLLDLVTMITPWETPFFTSAPKTQASSTLHEWVKDALAATSTAGAVEGEVFAATTLGARTRVQNWTQIYRKDVEVSNTQQAVDPAGVKSEYQYQVQKGLKELARNIESRIFASAGATTTGATGTGRIMKSLNDFYVTNTSGMLTATGSAAALTETAFNNTLEMIYTAGGNPESVYVSPGVKRDISAFAGPISSAVPTNTRNIAATDKKLVQAVDVYDSDYGLIHIVLDRFVPQSTTANDNTGSAFFIERAKNRIAFLRPMRHVPVASVGDSVRGMVLTELTLEVLEEASGGVLKRILT